eukprot:scaffold51563_cov31-Tisochrysis_lutea.AAC.4
MLGGITASGDRARGKGAVDRSGSGLGASAGSRSGREGTCPVSISTPHALRVTISLSLSRSLARSLARSPSPSPSPSPSLCRPVGLSGGGLENEREEEGRRRGGERRRGAAGGREGGWGRKRQRGNREEEKGEEREEENQHQRREPEGTELVALSPHFFLSILRSSSSYLACSADKISPSH